MKKILVIILSCCLLQSCISSRSKPSSFYGLRSIEIEVGGVFTSINKKILINTVNIPNYIDRPQIVTVKNNKIEYVIDETNRWIEPLGILMQNVIAENMQNYLINSTVRTFGVNERSYDYLVNVDVKRIDAVFGDAVYFECMYNVVNNRQNVMVSKKFVNNVKLDTDYVGLVNGISEVVSNLALDIIKSIKNGR